MIEMQLQRVGQNPDGMFGVLALVSETNPNVTWPFAVTLENQWFDNAQNVSCIPKGVYSCKRVVSPRFGDTFEVTHVPGRTHILFHKGNTDRDTLGCILVGEQFEPIDGKGAILHSGKAFAEFMSLLLGEDEFGLQIDDPW